MSRQKGSKKIDSKGSGSQLLYLPFAHPWAVQVAQRKGELEWTWAKNKYMQGYMNMNSEEHMVGHDGRLQRKEEEK